MPSLFSTYTYSLFAMQFYELQLFPKRSLQLGGFVDVQNISELSEKLNAKKLHFAILNPELAY
jgi:hypothetical protein